MTAPRPGRREPITFTFDPAARQQQAAAREAFLAERDRAEADLWATVRAQRAARAAQAAAWRDLP